MKQGNIFWVHIYRQTTFTQSGVGEQFVIGSASIVVHAWMTSRRGYIAK